MGQAQHRRGPQAGAAATPTPTSSRLSSSCVSRREAKRVIVSDTRPMSRSAPFPRSGIHRPAQKAGRQAEGSSMPASSSRCPQGQGAQGMGVYAEAREANKLSTSPSSSSTACAKPPGHEEPDGRGWGAARQILSRHRHTVADLAASCGPRLVVVDAVRILTANGPNGGNLAA